MPANASGGSGALLKYKDQQLLEKDLELEKLREQIQKQMNALEDLKNTLGCITEENQLLKDRIAKLEAIISATANKVDVDIRVVMRKIKILTTNISLSLCLVSCSFCL